MHSLSSACFSTGDFRSISRRFREDRFSTVQNKSCRSYSTRTGSATCLTIQCCIDSCTTSYIHLSLLALFTYIPIISALPPHTQPSHTSNALYTHAQYVLQTKCIKVLTPDTQNNNKHLSLVSQAFSGKSKYAEKLPRSRKLPSASIFRACLARMTSMKYCTAQERGNEH